MNRFIIQRFPSGAGGPGNAARSASRGRRAQPGLPLSFVPQGASAASGRTLVLNLAPHVTAHLENDPSGLAVLKSMIRAFQTYPAKNFAVFSDHLVFQFPHEENGKQRGFDCYCSFDVDLPSGIGTISVFAHQDASQAQAAPEPTPELHFRLDFARQERPMSEWASVRTESAKTEPTMFPLAGNKRLALNHWRDVNDTLLKGMKAASSFHDLFAGSGFITFWAANNAADDDASTGPTLHMNELNRHRHLTFEVVQKYPEQLKQSLARHREQLLYVYYRVLNEIPIESFRIDALERDQEGLADHILTKDGLSPARRERAAKMKYMKAKINDWVDDEPIDREKNARLSAALKDFIFSNVTLELPAESDMPDDAEIARQADQAVLYLLAQNNNRIQTHPVDFHASTGSNRHWSQITAGSATIDNKLLARYSRLRSEGDGRLLLGNTALIAQNKNAQLALPVTIDRASAALADVRITCADGWELLKSLQRGALAVIDPPYVMTTDNRRATVRYSRTDSREYTETGFLKKWDEYAMPAWMNGVRVVLFNRLLPVVADGLARRGFKVLKPSPPRVVENALRKVELRELVAFNFDADGAATLLPYRTHPEPEILLQGDEKKDDPVESSKSKRRKTTDSDK